MTAGSKIHLVGTYSIFQQKQKQSSESAIAVRRSYVRVLGIESDSAKTGKGTQLFSAEEENAMIEMARRPDIYQAFCASIAPSIYGNEGFFFSFFLLLLQKKQN